MGGGKKAVLVFKEPGFPHMDGWECVALSSSRGRRAYHALTRDTGNQYCQCYQRTNGKTSITTDTETLATTKGCLEGNLARYWAIQGHGG